MGLLQDKTGIIMGVANQNSIAAGCARFFSEEGAKLGFSHLPDQEGRDRMQARVRKVTERRMKWAARRDNARKDLGLSKR